MKKILIVDDMPEIRAVLARCLADGGFEFLEAGSGEEALEIARAGDPELVLLDVRLPGIDGFETLRLLKAAAPELPVILMTGYEDQASRLEGLRSGADDFVAKPPDGHELGLRIANLLTSRARYQALQRRNAELLELHRHRDEMASLVVHDIKNPLATLLANLEFMQGRLRELAPDLGGALSDCFEAARRILDLTEHLGALAKLEAGQMAAKRAPIRLVDMIEPALKPRLPAASAKNIRVTLEIDPEARLEVDQDLMRRVFENIMDNSLRYTPAAGHISVRATVEGDKARILIGNSGPPIPAAARAVIFQKFGQAGLGAERRNLGLGLYFCRLAAESHGGRIWVDEGPMPTVFGIELPLKIPPAPPDPEPHPGAAPGGSPRAAA